MLGRSAYTELGIVALLASAFVACSVDDRELHPRSSGGASGLAEGGGAPIDAGFGGDGGAGGATALPLPVCDYGAGVAEGCDTLVDNPGFAGDESGWAPEEGSVTMTWKSEDAASHPDSGSLSVVNSLSGEADGIAIRGAAQCLSTTPRQAYGIAADVFIPEAQGNGLDGGPWVASAGVSIIFYDGASCDGFTLSNVTSEVTDQPGAWAHLEGRGVSPQGAGSMSVRLVTIKNFREYTFEARFDNVLVKAN